MTPTIGQSDRTDKLSLYQVASLLALACLNMQDGFDILAITFSAGAIAEDWGLQRTQLGVVFSASLFGMMLGAMFLSPFADKVGRRIMTVFGLCISGLGMIAAASAANIEMLVAARLMTGIGIGGILASLNTLAAEYAGDRFRSLAVATFQLGYPLGAFFAGYIASWMLDIGTWRHVFWFGAALSFFFVPIILLLPESTDFLAKSGRTNALSEINRIRRRFGRAPLEKLDVELDMVHPGLVSGVLQLFSPRYALRTLLIWSAFFLLLISLYFVLSWTPRILVEMGFDEDVGNLGGRLLNLAGMFGMIGVGLLATFLRPALAAAIYLSAMICGLIALSLASQQIAIILFAVAVVGFFTHGSMVSLYAIVPTLYPTELRATGTGWAIGLSRFGAIIGPAGAGIFLDQGIPIQLLFQLFVLPVALSAMCAVGLWILARNEATQQDNTH